MTFQTLESTNNYLKDLLSNSKPVHEGTVIMAYTQTAGRGQRGNTWQSEPGQNLTFSFLLRPSSIPAFHPFELNKIVSVGIAKAIEGLCGLELFIKWPNDMISNQKKLGGILIENSLSGSRITHSVVGIGLNVNQTRFAPSLPNATSIAILTGHLWDLQAVLRRVLAGIETVYLQRVDNGARSLDETYANYLLWKGKEGRFKKEGKTFNAVVDGVNADGKLVLKNEGTLWLHDFKEVEFVL